MFGGRVFKMSDFSLPTNNKPHQTHPKRHVVILLKPSSNSLPSALKQSGCHPGHGGRSMPLSYVLLERYAVKVCREAWSGSGCKHGLVLYSSVFLHASGRTAGPSLLYVATVWFFHLPMYGHLLLYYYCCSVVNEFLRAGTPPHPFARRLCRIRC